MRSSSFSILALFVVAGCNFEAQIGSGSTPPPATPVAQNGAAPAPAPAPAPVPAPLPNGGTVTPTPAPLGRAPLPVPSRTTNPLQGVAITPANPPPAHPIVDPGMRMQVSRSAAPLIATDNDFGTAREDTDSLSGQVFFIPSVPQALPDLSGMAPSYRLYARTFAIGPRPFAGFVVPGAAPRNQNFAIRYEGPFAVANAGTYTLYIASEHGSRVTVDGQVALNNDGVHPVAYQQADFTWTAGIHTIRVDYFAGATAEVALELWVKPAGGAARVWTPEI